MRIQQSITHRMDDYRKSLPSAVVRRNAHLTGPPATGEVLGRCFQRRRTKEFLKFMDQVVATYGDREVHVVLDNLSTHSGADVDKWLTKNSNVTFHFTPTGSS